MTTLIQSLLKKSDLDYLTFSDSVSKFRVSTPESLIDTDFEYGLQSIKWETVQLVNNIPTFFSRSGDTPIPVVDVQCTVDQPFVYVTTTNAHNLINGSPIYIYGLKNITAEGYFVVTKVTGTNTFVYTAKYPQTLGGSIYIKDNTALFPGMVYQGTCLYSDQLEYATTNNQANSTITVKTVTPQGFSSNAGFTLANTIGARQIVVSNPVITGANEITYADHGLYTGMNVVYTYSATIITGLTMGSTYVVISTGKNTFKLGTNVTTPIAISGGTGGTHYFTTNDSASDGSAYNITSNIDNYTFQMKLNSSINSNVLTITNPQSSVVLENIAVASIANTITFSTNHYAITGAPVIYSISNGTSISGLTSGTTYYVIRINPTTIALATTRANAFNNIRTQLSGVGTSTTNQFAFPSILGEDVGSGTVSLSTTTNVITGTNVNFLSLYKPGMTIRVLQNANPINYNGVIGTNGTSTVTVNVSIATETPIKVTLVSGTTNWTVTANAIYYASYRSTTTISIHQTPLQASANTNPLTFTSAATLNVQVFTHNTMFESVITQVQNSTKLVVQNTPTITASGLSYYIPSSMFPFSDSLVYHRAFDGGIEMIPSLNADAQLIRQTRKYFRYQPGKGIQCSLSVNFSTPMDVDSIVASGNVATVTTRRPHRLTNNLSITVFGVTGVTGTLYNGDFIVTNVTPNTFKYTMAGTPSQLVAPGFPKFQVNAWTGSSLRAGLFDDQNGLFFEYDGVNVYAVRRDSVSQIAGRANVTFGSSLVTRDTTTTTAYTSQLTLKQNVVIRGQTYRVVNIVDDSNFYIQPPYRGATETACIISLVNDTRVPQSQWSIDKCDGTGPTGYDLNINKIQMIYFDYSWYGAGKIRYGFKDNAGVVRYVHEFIHNNQQDTAYFRSGNLPARYEVCNTGNPTWVPPLLHWGTAVIMDGRYDDDKAYLFTASGNVLNYTNGDIIIVQATIPTLSQSFVYDPYQQKTVSAWSITTTGGTGSNSWSSLQNIKSGTLIIGVNIPANTYTVGTPQKDNTDSTKATIFISKAPTGISLTPSSYIFGSTTDVIPAAIPLVSLRVAPSVDSSITGSLGIRELVNHMQLRLKSVDILTTNDTELRVVLNSFIDNRNFASASAPSLSQYIAHNKGDTIQDGTILFSYRVPGGVYDSSLKRTSTVTSYDISGLGYLGNSIQGGDSIFPDGPDVLTLVAVCLDPGGVSATTPYTVSARVTWAEAQA